MISSMTLTAPGASPDTGTMQRERQPGTFASSDGGRSGGKRTGGSVLAALRQALDARWWILSGGRLAAIGNGGTAADAIVLHPEFGIGLIALPRDGAALHPAVREIRCALAADGIAARFGGFLPVVGIALDPGDACPEHLPDRIARAFAAVPTISIRDPRWVDWAAASLGRLKPAPRRWWASRDRGAANLARHRRQPRNRIFAALMLTGIASTSLLVAVVGTRLHRLSDIAADTIAPAAETAAPAVTATPAAAPAATTTTAVTAAPQAPAPDSRPGGAAIDEAPPRQRAPAAGSAAPAEPAPRPHAARAAAALGSSAPSRQPAAPVRHPAPRRPAMPPSPHINENQP
jgi:hypothetical protein